MRRTRFAEGFNEIPNKPSPICISRYFKQKPCCAMLSVSLPESVACNTQFSGLGVSGVVLATPMACHEVAVAVSGILVQIQTTGPDGG